jgi:hypothetical protein
VTKSEEPLDTLIDEVARSMTEGAPAPDFSARVLRRIDERQPRLRWRAAWVAVPIAAAVVVVLIAMQVVRLPSVDVTRVTRGPEVVKGPDTTGVPPVVRLKPPLDVARGGPERVEGPDTTDDSSEVRLPPARAKRAVADQQTASSIDALAPPRLDVTPLEVTRLDAAVDAPESIELEQLEPIAPITVTPLSEDDTQRLRPH